MEHHFYLKQTLVIQTYLANIFSKTNEVNLSFQGKFTFFIISDKMKAFKQKVKFWQTCIWYSESNSFLVFDFSKKISSDITKWDF